MSIRNYIMSRKRGRQRQEQNFTAPSRLTPATTTNTAPAITNTTPVMARGGGGFRALSQAVVVKKTWEGSWERIKREERPELFSVSVTEEVFLSILTRFLPESNEQVIYLHWEKSEDGAGVVITACSETISKGSPGFVTTKAEDDLRGIMSMMQAGHPANGHLHTHPRFGAYWSSTDRDQHESTLRDLVNVSATGETLFVVVGGGGTDWLARRAFWADGKVSCLDTPVELLGVKLAEEKVVYSSHYYGGLDSGFDDDFGLYPYGSATFVDQKVATYYNDPLDRYGIHARMVDAPHWPADEGVSVSLVLSYIDDLCQNPVVLRSLSTAIGVTTVEKGYLIEILLTQFGKTEEDVIDMFDLHSEVCFAIDGYASETIAMAAWKPIIDGERDPRIVAMIAISYPKIIHPSSARYYLKELEKMSGQKTLQEIVDKFVSGKREEEKWEHHE